MGRGSYRNFPEVRLADVIDGSQCKNVLSGSDGIRTYFVANGYGEVAGIGTLYCTGTQTLEVPNPQGAVDVSVQPSSDVLYASCGPRQEIQPIGPKITVPKFSDNVRAGGAYSSAKCVCRFDGESWNGSVCTASVASIAFVNGPTETRPAGTGGKATLELAAKVVDGTTPKAGVVVSFTAEVTASSGGHEHDDISRPKGTLSVFRGTTDANGEVKVNFAAPQVAGIHTIKATCATCAGSPASKEITVKVPDLIAISPETPRNADGTFVYALTSVDPIHAGNGRYHRNQYYLTATSRGNLRGLIDEFANAGWGTVALNDASLYWGGAYDITGNWGAPHSGHRDGREIDISFTRAQNPVASAKQKDVYKKFCETKGVNVPFSILHHFVLIPHFHVYLEKQKACNRTEG